MVRRLLKSGVSLGLRALCNAKSRRKRPCGALLAALSSGGFKAGPFYRVLPPASGGERARYRLGALVALVSFITFDTGARIHPAIPEGGSSSRGVEVSHDDESYEEIVGCGGQ